MFASQRINHLAAAIWLIGGCQEDMMVSWISAGELQGLQIGQVLGGAPESLARSFARRAAS